MAMRETDKTWEFRQRPGFFLAGGVFMLLLAVLPLVIALFSLAYAEERRQVLFGLAAAGAFAIFFYGGFTALKRGVRGNAVVMRIDPKGFWHQVSARGRVIAWPVVERVYYGGSLYTRGTRVRVDQAAFRAIFPRKMDRVFHAVNWLEIGPVLPIVTGGLDMRPRQIHDLLTSYAVAHGGMRQER